MINFSILDGWWIEGYADGNGWAFGGKEIDEMNELKNRNIK